ncbi:hypothetical protein JOB18_048939 [Solea senegalensis]|uniref:Uncharacterized protein n=1 Tax=Solea senegalensis TaxID=28829 RepID=A0AAV6T289_SOLSE|nr:hypothetical protein JOB18_048939 [Solea senegalensis]
MQTQRLSRNISHVLMLSSQYLLSSVSCRRPSYVISTWRIPLRYSLYSPCSPLRYSMDLYFFALEKTAQPSQGH